MGANFNEEEEALQFEDSASNQMMVDSLNAVPSIQPQLNINNANEDNDKPQLKLIADEESEFNEDIAINDLVVVNDAKSTSIEKIIQIKDFVKKEIGKSGDEIKKVVKEKK